jgi:hypothetical protein
MPVIPIGKRGYRNRDLTIFDTSDESSLQHREVAGTLGGCRVSDNEETEDFALACTALAFLRSINANPATG